MLIWQNAQAVESAPRFVPLMLQTIIIKAWLIERPYTSSMHRPSPVLMQSAKEEPPHAKPPVLHM